MQIYDKKHYNARNTFLLLYNRTTSHYSISEKNNSEILWLNPNRAQYCCALMKGTVSVSN